MVCQSPNLSDKNACLLNQVLANKRIFTFPSTWLDNFDFNISSFATLPNKSWVLKEEDWLFFITSNFPVVLFKWRKNLIISWFITASIKHYISVLLMDLSPVLYHSPGHNPDLLPQPCIDALPIRHHHLQTLRWYSLKLGVRPTLSNLPPLIIPAPLWVVSVSYRRGQ